MSVLENIRTRLIAIEESLTTEASETANGALFTPPRLNVQDLPMFVNTWRGTRDVELFDVLYHMTRDIEIKLILGKTGDRGFAKNENSIAEWIETFYTDMVKRPRLELNGVGLTGVNYAQLTGDNGGVVEAYPVGNGAENFYTITFTMTIRYDMECTT
jgi:hypothetical protein